MSHGPQCGCCDRYVKKESDLSPGRGWCVICEDELKEVFALIRCAKGEPSLSVCTSPISCRMAKRCTQVKAALNLIAGKHATV